MIMKNSIYNNSRRIVIAVLFTLAYSLCAHAITGDVDSIILRPCNSMSTTSSSLFTYPWRWLVVYDAV